ncbi:DUF485 domain-containing protein [Streptomyces sp. NPDC090499]|uniref:DUF485 domain-containing protein n=1 Tax=Streptomyces sp. NPDC090499 TaxID=3365965 RepID=UPI0038143B0B
MLKNPGISSHVGPILAPGDRASRVALMACGECPALCAPGPGRTAPRHHPPSSGVLVHSHPFPASSGDSSARHPAHDTVQSQRVDRLRETTHRLQRTFVLVNATPFVTGIALACFTKIPALSVYGKITFGLVWGLLQCGVFVATAWSYDSRSRRSCDPIAESLTVHELRSGPSGFFTDNRPWR